jgi:negative regulator of flagellin synthesis FlgM
MIISNNQVQDTLKVYGKQLKTNLVRPKPETSSVAGTDAVSISDEGKLKQKVIQAVKQDDYFRQDKVEELRQAISTGTYSITDEEVAEKMIYRTIVDKIV